MCGRESWTSMGGHAQRREKLVSYLSSTKGSTLMGRRGWFTIASATTLPKQELHQPRSHSPRSGADKPVCLRPRCKCLDRSWGLVLIEVDPSTINYSQRTVSEVRVFDINKYEPIRVIEVDGQLVSYDNRRLLAAQNANLGSLTVDLLDKNDIAISKEGKQTTWWQRFQKRYADKRNIKAGGVVPDTGLSEKPIKASLIH